MLDEIASKTVHKDQVANRGKRSITLSEVNPVKIVSKNLQSFLEVSPVKKELVHSRKLQHHHFVKSIRIQSKCEKIRTRITPDTDNFYAVHAYE